ncbi:hypothetical protein Scep_021953 [Stephania cephalantha]|uniref:Uncharacterized protein n=1 Tax=Stephania cephalantha TaxID=152367 RepID=A0AAP0F594_9MAGN
MSLNLLRQKTRACTRSSRARSKVEQPTSSHGFPTNLNPLSKHPSCAVAPLRYSSSIMVEHPVKSVTPFRIFLATTQASRQCRFGRIRCGRSGLTGLPFLVDGKGIWISGVV